MSLMLAGKSIKLVKIVDDDASYREALAWIVEEASLTPLPDEGPLGNLDTFVENSVKTADAAIVDHKLTKGTYANFPGALAVARFYNRAFPALLCTAYSKVELVNMRLYREFIPVLIQSDRVNVDNISRGIEICINEFKGIFTQHRMSWKTLVRVVDIIEDSAPKMLDVVVPSWNSREIIRLPLDLIPAEFRNQVKTDYRFHAYVNKGAESQEELYFKNFQFG